jgi:glyoxylase-like metal-dependent hydrolase (beta-lactamase superfamily II)
MTSRKISALLGFGIALVMLATSCAGPAATSPPAANALDKALSGIGGKSAIQGLNAYTYESTGMRWLPFEGYLPTDLKQTTNFTVKVSHDIKSDNLRLDYSRDINFLRIAKTTSSEIINGQLGAIDGKESSAAGPAASNMTSSRWASTLRQHRLINPQLILREVADNPSLASDGGKAQLNGAEHLLLNVKDNVYPITLYINASTGLISKLATRENDYLRRDTDLEITYSNWQKATGGLQYPADITMTYGGMVILQERRGNFQANPTLAADLFKFPASASPTYDAADATRGERSSQFFQIFAQAGLPRDTLQLTVTPKEIAPGVFFIGGSSHNSLAIEQSNGIAVVEAPLDEARSKAVIAWVKSKWPGKPITYIISDHHHIDHSSGLRTYAAEGATLVTGAASEQFFIKNMAAKSSIEPDALELNPKAVVVKAVPANGSFAIPDALRPISVYHVTSTHAADMVMAFVEKEGVVFISDIYTPPGDPGPSAKELDDAIVKFGIKVNTIAGGHGGDVIAYDTFKSKLPK